MASHSQSLNVLEGATPGCVFLGGQISRQGVGLRAAFKAPGLDISFLFWKMGLLFFPAPGAQQML